MVGYPGSKKGWSVPTAKYTRIYDLFAGGLNWSREVRKVAPKAKIHAAETNPIQRAMLTITPARMKRVMTIANEKAATLKLFLNPKWGGTGTYADYYDTDQLTNAWRYVCKVPFDRGMGGQVDDESIAAQIIVSTYGYGANIRMSSKGMNISVNHQKLFKQSPKPPEKITLTKMFSDYRDMPIKGYDRAIALIDPMYWMPVRCKKTHKALTACYPGHNPYGDDGYEMYHDAIERCCRVKMGTVLIAGYYSDELNALIINQARYHGYNVNVISHGKADTQANKHKHRQTHGKRSANVDLLGNDDTEWQLTFNPGMITLRGGLQLMFSDHSDEWGMVA
jgi:hypothetical protein